MRKNTTRSGKRAEVFATKELHKQGYTVTRAHLSRGAADLIAWKPDSEEIRFVQVKFQSHEDKKNWNRWGQPSAVKRIVDEFIEAKLPPNGVGELWVWRSNKGWAKQEQLVKGNLVEGSDEHEN